MKNPRYLLLLLLLFSAASLRAQVYNNIARYTISSTPAHGVKIKTNIPFQSSADMVTLTLYGYAYGQNSPMNLQLSFYIWHSNGTVFFWNPTVSSAAAYTPNLRLANEDGKVVVYVDEKVYFHQFYVNAFSGLNRSSNYYSGWTVVDEPLNGTSIAEATYKNTFKGNVAMPGGIWNSEGKVGIGTSSPQAKLAVNGNILANEIKVKTDIAVPDYVFEPDYALPSLSAIANYVKEYKHLPEVPSAKDIAAEGLDLAQMNLLLLKKVEELTLHLIEKDKDIATLKQSMGKLEQMLINK